MPEKGKNDFPIILEYISKANDAASSANDFILRPVAGERAFRYYSHFGGPAMNKSGNLRGMVISKEMHKVYKISGNVASKLAVVGALVEVGKEMDRIETVYKSSADTSEKYSRITLLCSAAVLRSVTGVVPTAVGLVAKSIEGYGMLYTQLTGDEAGNEVGAAAINAADWVKETHSYQWDRETWYNVIEANF